MIGTRADCFEWQHMLFCLLLDAPCLTRSSLHVFHWRDLPFASHVTI